MPISPIVLQRRHAELGRIRLGAKRGGNGAPMKLEQFRFTSHSERYVRDLAELYGGKPQPWDNNGVPSWEVYTDATSVPVIAVKGGLTQWMETWSGGGCVHRCDGERGADGELCNPDDRAHQMAKPTTRLSVMLPELEAIGVWRMESHGWNAAAEIPAVAELAQFVGDLVPANLHLVERRAIKDGKTSRFVVPVLDLQIGTARLKEIVAARSGAPELEAPSSGAGERPALETPASASAEPPAQQYIDQYEPAMRAIADAADLDRLALIWDTARERNMVGNTSEPSAAREAFITAWKARAHELKAAHDQAAATAQPDADGAVDAEVVGEADTPLPDVGQDDSGLDADAIWQQVLAAGGQRGMSLADVEDDFAQRMGGVSSAEASATELQHYLALLTSERAA
ncbi:hypothetical protein [Nocardioides sp. SYSU DS0663]|uniref:recombination directionality factor n=1 Tax=Nocardioides sp. SYSU DS0663 TaxID=3416445 RepID=UPI003F4C165D